MDLNKIINKGDYSIIVVDSKTHGIVEFKIDSEDIEKIAQHKWSAKYAKTVKNFYAHTRVEDKILRLHRLIMATPSNLQVDHINRDTTDNRKRNLKNCTAFENHQNKGNNTSGRVGVYYSLKNEKWYAQIRNDKKNIHLGYYKKFKDASDARAKAEKLYFNVA